MIVKRLMLMLVVVALLAACGGGGTPAASGGDSGAPAGNTGGGGAAAGGESFSFEVGGAETVTLATPDFNANYSTDDLDEETTIHQLWFGGDGARAISIMFYGDEPPAAGTFTLTDEFTTDPGTVSLLYVNNSEGVTAYTQTGGTVTLTQSGDSYSGSVDATLSGGAAGASEPQTLTLKGTFNEIQ